MSLLKEELLQQAKREFKSIYPCSSFESLSDCFTVVGKTILFWFNTEDRPTHLLTAEMD